MPSRYFSGQLHIARFRGRQPSFSGTADLGRPLSVSQVEKGSEISPFPHSTSGTERSNLSRSAIESFSVCNSATDDRNTPSSYPATIQSVSFSDLSENHTKSARVRDIFDSARRFSDFSIRFRWASTGRRPASFLWSAGLIGRPVAQASRRLPHEALLLAPFN